MSHKEDFDDNNYESIDETNVQPLQPHVYIYIYIHIYINLCTICNEDVVIDCLL